MPTNQSLPTAESENKTANPKGHKHPVTDELAGLRPAALARRWDCCRQTIYNMIADEELHSFKVRNSRIIPFTEIERIERGGDA